MQSKKDSRWSYKLDGEIDWLCGIDKQQRTEKSPCNSERRKEEKKKERKKKHPSFRSSHLKQIFQKDRTSQMSNKMNTKEKGKERGKPLRCKQKQKRKPNKRESELQHNDNCTKIANRISTSMNVHTTSRMKRPRINQLEIQYTPSSVKVSVLQYKINLGMN